MTELVDYDLAALMRAASTGNEVAVFNALLAPAKSTVAARKAAQRQAIEQFDLDRLIALQDKMARIVDTLTKNEIRWDEGTMVLTDEQAASLMAEFLDEREVAEALDVRREMIKERVFAHIDEADGYGQNGTVDVPELGKKFCREGCAPGTPDVDKQRLQALLGERWLETCEEIIVPAVTIPERIEYVMSIEKVLDLAQRDPEVLEHLRTCLVPGKPKSPRFVLREL
jgi:hypothetical protein